MSISGKIPRPGVITSPNQPYVFGQIASAWAINDALATHRHVTLAAGDHLLNGSLRYPADHKSFDWSDPGGSSYVLQGPGSSFTRLWAEHSSPILRQSNSHEHGVYHSPKVAGLTFIGNEHTYVGLQLDGWRRGLLDDVVVMGIPNGLGAFIDGTTTGGSWYNTVSRCRFGDLRNDPRYWVKQGLKLGGFNSQSGKTNESSVVECQFLNCHDWGLGLSGVGPFNSSQNGINGGSAMNHSQGNTFYGEQALFRWDSNGSHVYKPVGIWHDSDGGHVSFGDYFERLYNPLRQSSNVADYRFNIPLATIKNSGHFTPNGTNTNWCEMYREGGGEFRMGPTGHNAWTNQPIQKFWV